MTGALSWVGAQARWVMLVGVFAGLAFPAGAAALRPVLPVIVALVYALALLRIDPVAIMKGLAAPRRALAIGFGVFMLMVVAPVVVFALARAVGVGPDAMKALVYTMAAPPIASAAAICLIVGFEGRVALELTVVSALALPALGPAVTGTLLGADLDVDPAALALRMALMIFGGFAMALVGRRLLGPARIERNKAALDGLGAIGFLLFVLPLFDGVGPTMLARPGLSLIYLALAAAIILGSIWLALRAPGAKARSGALGVVAGSRSVAIYMAALPPDPVFTLYVAIYQLPMAAIVMAFRGRAGQDGASQGR